MEPVVRPYLVDKKPKLPLYEIVYFFISHVYQSKKLGLFVSKLRVSNNLHLHEVEKSFICHVCQSEDWISSFSSCVNVTLQFDHPSPLVMLLLIGSQSLML